MKKKLIIAGLLALSPLCAHAQWEVGGSYINISEDSDDGDLSLGVIAATVGYAFPMQGNFTLVPELRVGFGMSDDTFTYEDIQVKTEIDQMIGVNLRARFDFDGGFSFFLMPSYTNFELSGSATSGGVTYSASDDTSEFGLGFGGGYQFNDAFGVEAAYEFVDDTDLFSVGLRIKL